MAQLELVHPSPLELTQAEPRGGRIVIAYGRDAADVALAIEFGPAKLSGMRVWAQEPWCVLLKLKLCLQYLQQ